VEQHACDDPADGQEGAVHQPGLTSTSAVAHLLAALDAERLADARAWRVNAERFLDLFAGIGSTSREAAAAGDFRQALLDSAPNRLVLEGALGGPRPGSPHTGHHL
jgi:hypothetical protein